MADYVCSEAPAEAKHYNGKTDHDLLGNPPSAPEGREPTTIDLVEH
jgi:hypothetical protein